MIFEHLINMKYTLRYAVYVRNVFEKVETVKQKIKQQQQQ